MVFVDVGLHQIFAPKGIYVLSILELVVGDSDERFEVSTVSTQVQHRKFTFIGI
jgi:hypothetical protein